MYVREKSLTDVIKPHFTLIPPAVPQALITSISLKAQSITQVSAHPKSVSSFFPQPSGSALTQLEPRACIVKQQYASQDAVKTLIGHNIVIKVNICLHNIIKVGILSIICLNIFISAVVNSK